MAALPPVRGRAGRAARWGRSLAAVGVVLLVTGALLSMAHGGASAAPTALGARSDAATPATLVNLTDAPSFTPNAVAGISGTTLSLHLVNTGNFSHTFTLSKVANYTFNRSWTPGDLNTWFAHNASWVNVTLAPASSAWENLTIPATDDGSYEFVSVVPYQFQSGMAGYLNITSASSAAGVTLSVSTSASALAFVPAELNLSGSSFPMKVDMQVSNLGSSSHTWTLVPQANVNVTSGNYTSYFQTHPPAASVNVPTTPGQVIWANFTLSQKGVYQYICEIPGHLAAGMQGFLYVGVPPPAPVSPPSTAVVAPLLLVGGGAILGIAIVLVLVASLVGRIPPPSYSPHH
jgi:uncharacterized cupredoxin-like copper-binding protein